MNCDFAIWTVSCFILVLNMRAHWKTCLCVFLPGISEVIAKYFHYLYKAPLWDLVMDRHLITLSQHYICSWVPFWQLLAQLKNWMLFQKINSWQEGFYHQSGLEQKSWSLSWNSFNGTFCEIYISITSVSSINDMNSNRFYQLTYVQMFTLELTT